MIKKILKVAIPIIFFTIASAILFSPFLIKGEVPLPADIVIGSYYPFRDEVWQGRTTAYPVKNFTIFDPVRQIYPWRYLAVSQIKQGIIPLWNPDEFTGVPLLGNPLTSVFYPLNFLFFIFNFPFAWSIYIFIQPLLAALFMYLFLLNLKLSKFSSIFGAIAFAFSSFMMMRLEFGVSGHTVLWFPLILFCIDKYVSEEQRKYLWILTGAFLLSFFSGYIQGFIYLSSISVAYFFWRLREDKNGKNYIKLLAFVFALISFVLLALPQIVPFVKLLSYSARKTADIGVETVKDYYLPSQNIIQLFVPDFFGNPATWNYWGKPNYTEFCSYLGTASIFFIIFGLLFSTRKDKKFWLLIIGFSLIFIIRNPVSILLERLRIPLLSSLTPSRLIFPIDFSFSVLASFGISSLLDLQRDNLIKRVGKALFISIFLYLVIFSLALGGYLFFPGSVWADNFYISSRNMVLPVIFLFITIIFLKLFCLGEQKIRNIALVGFIFILSFDLVRQGKKYNSFIPSELIFPRSELIDKLVSVNKYYRFQKTNVEIFTSNFQIMYGLNSIGGYDSFYPERFSNLVSIDEILDSSSKDIFLGDHQSKILAMLGTKYIFSLDKLVGDNLTLIGEKGETKLYENSLAFPRAFLVDEAVVGNSDEEVLDLLNVTDLQNKVILEKKVELNPGREGEKSAEIISYQANKVEIKVNTSKDRVMVLSDSFYPGWEAFLDGKKVEIYRANYNIRAVKVPMGNHKILFAYRPKTFFLSCIISFTFLLILILVNSPRAQLLGTAEKDAAGRRAPYDRL